MFLLCEAALRSTDVFRREMVTSRSIDVVIIGGYIGRTTDWENNGAIA